MGEENFIGTNLASGNAPIEGTVSFFVEHAEGDAFAQALQSGNHSGQSGTLYVTKAPCSFCASSISAVARSMGLSNLKIYTPNGLFGIYTPETGLVRVRMGSYSSSFASATKARRLVPSQSGGRHRRSRSITCLG